MKTSTEKRIQVLLITGELTGEHDPKVNSLLRRMLESTSRFKGRAGSGARLHVLVHLASSIIRRLSRCLSLRRDPLRVQQHRYLRLPDRWRLTSTGFG